MALAGLPSMKIRSRPPMARSVLAAAMFLAAAGVLTQGRGLSETPTTGATEGADETPPLLVDYCSRCHNDQDRKANFSIEDLKGNDPAHGLNVDAWERIFRKVSLGEMPPREKPQPDPAARAAFVTWLQGSLDGYAMAHPDPGRATIRRLNRVEYANAVRDLLDLKVDFSRELPQDNSGFGFDNIADVLSVSPTLMGRYVVVAGKIARLATGLTSPRPVVTSYEVPKDGSVMNSGRPAYNERANDALPLGSRGGGAFAYYAPRDGVYEVSGWLNANTNNETDRQTEDRISTRIALKAGPHRIGLSFRRQLAPDESVQTLRNTLDVVPMPVAAPVMLPLDVSVDGARVKALSVPSYRLSPRYSQQNFPRDVLQIDVAGPYSSDGGVDTPSRKRIFLCRPKHASAEEPCARSILASLARRAYRRPVTAADVAPLMHIYAAERSATDFDHGVEAAVEAILVSPHFLYMAEQDAGARGSVHRISDLELASRLSLFLWSSIPDDRLLTLAEKNRLHRPDILEAEVTRMLDDRRAEALTRNFAGQWLYLRNLDQQRPDISVFPQFDQRLREAMARETEMFFGYVLNSNRSILDFIAADYSFLNQRLAEHYGIPGVQGTAFRKVALSPAWHRGGLLGQASILTVTSYGNRTSVVKRGRWILDNMLAAPPPPPPPDIPALKTEHDGRPLTARQQLELHRSQPQCMSCHKRMDPLGFSLENYDATGAFRKIDAGQAIDASADLPDGTRFSGLDGLRQILMTRRDEFAAAFTERLMTYALGRGVEAQDMPAIRAIARSAAADQYRIRTIVKGIVTSTPFVLRKAPKT